MERSCECHVALICQRGDDKSRAITQVFVTITEPSIRLLAETVEASVITFEWSTIKFSNFFPVVPKLLCPVETFDIIDFRSDHVIYDCSVMDIKHDQCTHHLPLQSV